MGHDTADQRTRSIETLEQAAEHFVALAARVTADGWEAPALDAWSMRSLVGHASRALSLLTTYLADEVPPGTPITSAADYYAGFTFDDAVNRSVAERGVASGLALGDDPMSALRTITDEALASVRAQPVGRVLGTPAGPITLDAYLPTRLLELTVHSLDLAAALGVDAEPPPAAMRETLALVGDVVVTTGRGAAVVRALTGRGSLPAGFTIM
jgi:hypothetical protein